MGRTTLFIKLILLISFSSHSIEEVTLTIPQEDLKKECPLQNILLDSAGKVQAAKHYEMPFCKTKVNSVQMKYGAATRYITYEPSENDWYRNINSVSILQTKSGEYSYFEDLTFDSSRFTNVQFAHITFQNSDFKNSVFDGGNFEFLNFDWTVFHSAKFKDNSFENLSFKFSDLSNADFSGGNRGSENNFVGAKFNDAILYGAPFVNAVFGCEVVDGFRYCTSLSNAKLVNLNCLHSKTNSECDPESAAIVDFSQAKNIKDIVYDYRNPGNRPVGIDYIISFNRQVGNKRIADELTYVIKHGEMMEKIYGESSREIEKLAANLQLILLEHTVRWGLEPGRALKIFVYLLFIMALVYSLFLFLSWMGLDTCGRLNCINIVEVENFDIEKAHYCELLAKIREQKLNSPQFGPDKFSNLVLLWFIFKHAFWFSVLTSFHFGWRELTASSWLKRLQTTNFHYLPNGTFRVVSGLHSIISLYFLVLWGLTEFTSPWG